MTSFASIFLQIGHLHVATVDLCTLDLIVDECPHFYLMTFIVVTYFIVAKMYMYNRHCTVTMSIFGQCYVLRF